MIVYDLRWWPREPVFQPTGPSTPRVRRLTDPRLVLEMYRDDGCYHYEYYYDFYSDFRSGPILLDYVIPWDASTAQRMIWVGHDGSCYGYQSFDDANESWLKQCLPAAGMSKRRSQIVYNGVQYLGRSHYTELGEDPGAQWRRNLLKFHCWHNDKPTLKKALSGYLEVNKNPHKSFDL